MINWITESVGTGAYREVPDRTNEYSKIDVRGLIDGSGNVECSIRKIIDASVKRIKEGERIVLCCDFGRSRSNAIAAAVLSTCNETSLQTELRRVGERVPVSSIDARFLTEVERTLGIELNHDLQDIETNFLIVGDSPLAPLVHQSLVENRHSAALASQDSLKQSKLYSEVRRTRCKAVIDLTQPIDFNSTESMGKRISATKDLIEICLATSVRLIHCSYFDVFDRYVTTELLADETTPRYPRSNFGIACTNAETLVEDAIRFDRLNATILRFSRVFGPSYDSRRLPMRLISMLEEGLAIEVHRCRNGAPALDLLFETDAASAIVNAALVDAGGLFNIGSGALTTTQRIAEMYATIRGLSLKMNVTDVDRPSYNIALNSQLAFRTFGWQATVGPNKAFEMIAASNLKWQGKNNREDIPRA